jgi:hypothetical protein
MECFMLRKMGIVIAVVALGLTAIQTDAFARGGGGGGGHGGGGGFGGGGGHFGGGGFGGGHFGGGGFGGGHIGGFGGGHMGGFGGPRVGGGFGGAHVGAIPHGGFNTRNSGLRVRGDRFGRRGFVGGYGWGGWCDDWPYDTYYGYGYYNGYCY